MYLNFKNYGNTFMHPLCLFQAFETTLQEQKQEIKLQAAENKTQILQVHKVKSCVYS